MFNIFKNSKRIIEKLNKEGKEYWENADDYKWETGLVMPDGTIYDEKELFEAILESDRQRLLKFG
jgi:hypothetical protein